MSVLTDLHGERVRRLPCIACFMLTGRPPHTLPRCEEVHHLEIDRHPLSDFLVLPLCFEHHQGFTGIHGRHRLGFERLHGITQLQMLGGTTMLLLADRSALVGG